MGPFSSKSRATDTAGRQAPHVESDTREQRDASRSRCDSSGDEREREPLERWRQLDLQSRGLFVTVVRYLRDGKYVLASNLDDRARADVGMADADVHRVHARYFESVASRLEGPDVASLCDFDNRYYSRIFDDMLPSASGLSLEGPEASEALVGRLLEIGVPGVLADVGYLGLSTFAERHDVLDELMPVVEQMRSDDRTIATRATRQLADVLSTAALSHDDVEVAFEQILMLVSGLIRRLQQQFDFLEAGLIPDEFVAHAIERWTTYREQLETELEARGAR